METKFDQWLSEIEEHVAELADIPLWGYPPPFPWDALTQKVQEEFELSDVKLSISSTKWLSFQELLSGCGENPIELAIELAPLSEPVIWVIGRDMMGHIAKLALSSEETEMAEDLKEGFYRFFALEVLGILAQLHCFGDLHPQMGAVAPLPEEGALSLDIAMEVQGNTIWGRLICPNAFLQLFKHHFSLNKPSLLEMTKGKKISLPLPISIGGVELTTDEWGKVEEGDFIILDRCDYNFEKKEGVGLLGKIPMHYNEEGMKILEQTSEEQL